MRLARIAEEYGDQVTMEWRSFLLRPEPEPRPLAEFVEYTTKWARPAAMEPATTFTTWASGEAPPTHSFPAALAGKVAATFGPAAHRAFSDRLFAAYFTENRTISRRSVLLDVAAEAGLDRADFEQRWVERENDLVLAVWQDHGTAVKSGIQGVPAVVVDRRWLISGAVDVDHYHAAIAHARSAPPIEESPAAGQ